MKATLANQRLIIRADADASIGTGHVMRCLALAQAWQEQGGEVVFVGRILSAALQQKIKENDCGFIELANPFPAPDDFELLSKLIQKNKQASCSWVVVDGYHFTADYTHGLRQAGAKVLLLDDYAHQSEYVADLLLNQNLGSEKLSYKLNQDATVLLGTKYVLLRAEFLREQNRGVSNIFPEDAKNVLVTLGGADPENVTSKLIDALDLVGLPQLEVKIVVGPTNPHFALLKDRMDNVSFKGELLPAVNNMAPLMKWADVAVTAGGSTCWELAYLGIVLLVVVVADNQEKIAKNLGIAGAAHSLGWAQHVLDVDEIARVILSVISNKNERMRMSAIGKQLVDGLGVQRVIESMKEVL